MPGLSVSKKTNYRLSVRPYYEYKITSESLVNVFIKNSAGVLIRKIEENQWKDAGAYQVAWDQKDDMGGNVPDGEYTLQIIANVVVDSPSQDDFKTEAFTPEIYNAFLKDGFGQEAQVKIDVVAPAFVRIEQVSPGVITSSPGQQSIDIKYTVTRNTSVQSGIQNKEYAIAGNSFNPIDYNEFEALTGQVYNRNWDGKNSNEIVAPDGVYVFRYRTESSEWAETIIGVDRNPIVIIDYSVPVSFAPKKGATEIKFKLNENGYVTISVIDKKSGINLRNIIERQLFDGQVDHQVSFDGKDSSGQYLKEGEYKIVIIAEDLTGNSSDMKE